LSRPPIELPVEGLSDGAIRLRLIADADVPAVIDACQDPEIPRWTKVPDHYGEAEAREWLAQQEADHSTGSALHLVITDASSDRLLGSAGFTGIDWEDMRAAIGYWVAAHARGRGVATRAVSLLADWGIDELGFGRVEIKAQAENERSQRVAERAGFAREGLLRSYALMKGRRRDMILFSLLPGDRAKKSSPSDTRTLA
jgi:RimJ/RimL family protein N-acetyltransferase